MNSSFLYLQFLFKIQRMLVFENIGDIRICFHFYALESSLHTAASMLFLKKKEKNLPYRTVFDLQRNCDGGTESSHILAHTEFLLLLTS